MTDLPRRPAVLLVASACVLLAMLALRTLEAQWPPLALWAFVLLSLTLGFGHGALDAVLLLGQFAPRSKALAVSAAYLLCVLLAGWALSWSVPWALLLLVLMSVWHFGVMWPMLVARDAMSQLVQGTLGAGFGTAWSLWHMLAQGWLILVCACALGWMVQEFLSRKKLTHGGAAQSQSQTSSTGHPHHALCAAVEILALLGAYLLLSPLLAFAMYFGVYHCLAHVARVRRAVQAHSALVSTRYAVAFMASALATAVLLALLWWFLPAMQWLGGVSDTLANSGQVLQWLVVSLAAVTLPHLLLVSYSARWLGR
jgi:beta-carotene 15,15'-dioxygenase